MSIFCCRRLPGPPSPPAEAWAYSFFAYANSLPIEDNVDSVSVLPSSDSHLPFSSSALHEFNDGYAMAMTYLGYEIPDDVGKILSAEWVGEFDFGNGAFSAPFDSQSKLEYMGEDVPDVNSIWQPGLADAVSMISAPKDTPPRTPFSYTMSNIEQLKPGRTVFVRVSPLNWDDPTDDPGYAYLGLLSPRPPGPTPPGFNFPPGPVLVLTTSDGTVTVRTKNTPPLGGGA